MPSITKTHVRTRAPEKLGRLVFTRTGSAQKKPLSKAERDCLRLATRVINAISRDWEPGLAAFLVLEYFGRAAEAEIKAMIRDRRHALRQLGPHRYAAALKTFRSDRRILARLADQTARCR